MLLVAAVIIDELGVSVSAVHLVTKAGFHSHRFKFDRSIVSMSITWMLPNPSSACASMHV